MCKIIAPDEQIEEVNQSPVAITFKGHVCKVIAPDEQIEEINQYHYQKYKPKFTK